MYSCIRKDSEERKVWRNRKSKRVEKVKKKTSKAKKVCWIKLGFQVKERVRVLGRGKG
jgi:hypothetical protein